jgi:hypothetical protein
MFFHARSLNARAGLIPWGHHLQPPKSLFFRKASFTQKDGRTTFKKVADYRLINCPLSRRKYKHGNMPAQERTQDNIIFDLEMVYTARNL